MALYHYKLGFPPWYQPATGKLPLRYGSHAKLEAVLEKYAVTIPQLPNPLDLSEFQPVEIETLGESLVKTVYRGPLDEFRDLCLVVNADDGYVRTVWVNLKLDKHATLRLGRYEKP